MDVFPQYFPILMTIHDFGSILAQILTFSLTLWSLTLRDVILKRLLNLLNEVVSSRKVENLKKNKLIQLTTKSQRQIF